ncbi:hypothetical protein K474DRAFT_1211889 [Panus rudis PR-1116 ss-1]|nr:hypothetical protein K474DRAFT_1211889 [Panus rudis PR-1116 ss-1]
MTEMVKVKARALPSIQFSHSWTSSCDQKDRNIQSRDIYCCKRFFDSDVHHEANMTRRRRVCHRMIHRGPHRSHVGRVLGNQRHGALQASCEYEFSWSFVVAKVKKHHRGCSEIRLKVESAECRAISQQWDAVGRYASRSRTPSLRSRSTRSFSQKVMPSSLPALSLRWSLRNTAKLSETRRAANKAKERELFR